MHKPAGLLSIPRDLVKKKKEILVPLMCKKTFDVVVVLGKCIPERALATKQTLHWPEVASQPSLLETKDVIDKRVRELLATL